MTAHLHILIVDDDIEIRTLLGNFLKQYGYRVSLATDGADMFRILKKEKNNVDLIILDVMLPGEDGLSLCRTLRKTTSIPIIMVTAVSEETDRIIGLELGADDYIAKPFNPRELLARIKAVLRRTHEYAEEDKESRVVQFADWTLDMAARRLFTRDNMEVSLSSGEYELLVTFIEHPRRVLSRDQLMDYTRNREAMPFDRSIDIQVSRLRRKIEPDPKNPTIIKTVRNGGYMFTPQIKRL